MGFLSNLKNFVTGGSAIVSIEWDELSLHDTFTITVRAKTGASPVKIKRVYLEVEGREEVTVPNYEVVLRVDQQEYRHKEDVSCSGRLLHLQYQTDEEQELAANETYEWTFAVTFPEGAQPPYVGNCSRYRYRVYAGLDTVGNDPDSGWVELA